MAPKRNRPVLYELIARGHRSKTWTTSPRATASVATGRPVEPKTASMPLERGMSRRPLAAPPPAEASSGEETSILGGQVRITTSWPVLAALGAALLVVVVVAYYVGRRSTSPPEPASPVLEQILSGTVPAAPAGPEPPAGELAAAHRPAGPSAVPGVPGAAAPAQGPASPPAVVVEPQPESAGEGPPRATDDPTQPFAFESGASYVVVQHLSKRQSGIDAARKIREFLESNGVPCVVQARGGDLQVIATEPFRIKRGSTRATADERKRATDFMNRIKELGKQFTLTAGYSFDKCYLREF